MGRALADHETNVQSQSVYSTVHVYCTLSTPEYVHTATPQVILPLRRREVVSGFVILYIQVFTEARQEINIT